MKKTDEKIKQIVKAIGSSKGCKINKKGDLEIYLEFEKKEDVESTIKFLNTYCNVIKEEENDTKTN